MGLLKALFGGLLSSTNEDESSSPPFRYELIEESSFGGGYKIREVATRKTFPWHELPQDSDLEAFQVVGIASYRRDTPGAYKIGWPIVLRPEPDNPKDSDAVAVWDMTRHSKIGYVPKKEAKRIGENLRANKYRCCLTVWRSLNNSGYTMEARALLVGHGASLKLLGTVKAASEHPKASLRIDY